MQTEPEIHVIMKNVEDRNIVGLTEVIGVFTGDWEDADAILDKLNEKDPAYTPRYFREYAKVITATNALRLADLV